MSNKKYILISVLVLLIILTGTSAGFGQEHRLEVLDIKVELLDDGSALIRERRVANLVEGTENYIVIENLGQSQIHSFTVIEDGISYDYIEDWDINASREEKSYKNGIIETANGYELAWGIGEYGHHDYLLEYRVTNFIKQLEDAQMLFWQFVNPDTNIPPENVTITISKDGYDFNPEEQGIWAFGFEGDINFENGDIVARSRQPLDSWHYVTILTRFEDGMFTADERINENFDYIRDRAFEGSDYGEEQNIGSGNTSTSTSGIINAVSGIIRGLVPLIVIGGIIAANKNNKRKPRKFKRKYKEEYYRDLPYKGEFVHAYSQLYDMGVSNFERLLTAFILKWIKEEKIRMIKEKKGLIRKREVTNIVFSNRVAISNPQEKELFEMMKSAAGSNEILEEDEFTKWARRNHNKLTSWEKKVESESAMKLQEEGYLNLHERRKLIFFKDYDLELTSKGEEFEERVYKYINYLHDFSLLNEHEAINVTIWDEIMIWAGLLGLTEKVREEFIKIYPNYEQETVYTGNTIFLASSFSRNVSSARTQATRSSGGGGSASLGGGGGSFGGGSGGGTR